MANPLVPYASCTLVFQVPTSTPAATATAIATEARVFLAFLKPKTDNAYQRSQIGGDLSEAGQRCEGYLMVPALMPLGVQAEQGAECIFWRVDNSFKLPPNGFASVAALTAFRSANAAKVGAVGTFYWEQNIPGAFGVEAILGDKLKGRFVARSRWINAL